jgi:hypothetical protein
MLDTMRPIGAVHIFNITQIGDNKKTTYTDLSSAHVRNGYNYIISTSIGNVCIVTGFYMDPKTDLTYNRSVTIFWRRSVVRHFTPTTLDSTRIVDVVENMFSYAASAYWFSKSIALAGARHRRNGFKMTTSAKQTWVVEPDHNVKIIGSMMQLHMCTLDI